MTRLTVAVNAQEWPARIHKAGCAHLRLADPGLVFTTDAGQSRTAEEVVERVVAENADFFGSSRPTFAPCVPKAIREG